MLDSNIKKAKLTLHRPSEKAAVTPLFLISGYSFRISLWKGASERKVETYQDTKLQGTTYNPVYEIEKEMYEWAGYQKYFP